MLGIFRRKFHSVCYLLRKMLVDKAREEISSNIEGSFGI